MLVRITARSIATSSVNRSWLNKLSNLFVSEKKEAVVQDKVIETEVAKVDTIERLTPVHEEAKVMKHQTISLPKYKSDYIKSLTEKYNFSLTFARSELTNILLNENVWKHSFLVPPASGVTTSLGLLVMDRLITRKQRALWIVPGKVAQSTMRFILSGILNANTLRKQGLSPDLYGIWTRDMHPDIYSDQAVAKEWKKVTLVLATANEVLQWRDTGYLKEALKRFDLVIADQFDLFTEKQRQVIDVFCKERPECVFISSRLVADGKWIQIDLTKSNDELPTRIDTNLPCQVSLTSVAISQHGRLLAARLAAHLQSLVDDAKQQKHSQTLVILPTQSCVDLWRLYIHALKHPLLSSQIAPLECLVENEKPFMLMFHWSSLDDPFGLQNSTDGSLLIETRRELKKYWRRIRSFYGNFPLDLTLSDEKIPLPAVHRVIVTSRDVAVQWPSGLFDAALIVSDSKDPLLAQQLTRVDPKGIIDILAIENDSSIQLPFDLKPTSLTSKMEPWKNDSRACRQWTPANVRVAAQSYLDWDMQVEEMWLQELDSMNRPLDVMTGKLTE